MNKAPGTRHLAPLLTAGLFAAGLLSGCGTENAILSVSVKLGAGDARAGHAVITASLGEDAAPRWTPARVESVALAEDGATLDVEVVAEEGDFEKPLQLWVAFCASPTCDGETPATGPGGTDGGEGDAAGDGGVQGAAPVIHYELDRAFYRQARTRWDTTAPPLSTVRASGGYLELRVGPCEIAGCRAGSATSWCRLDGTHFCEGDD